MSCRCVEENYFKVSLIFGRGSMITRVSVRKKRLVIFWDNFEILLEVFIQNTPRNHCITYTNIVKGEILALCNGL